MRSKSNGKPVDMSRREIAAQIVMLKTHIRNAERAKEPGQALIAADELKRMRRILSNSRKNSQQ